MAMIDILHEEEYLNEGKLTTLSIKKDFLRHVWAYFSGEADMEDKSGLEKCLKSLKTIRNVKWLGSAEQRYAADLAAVKVSVRFGTYVKELNRFLIETKDNAICVADIYPRDNRIGITLDLKKMYDPKSCKVPANICKDFLSDGLKLLSKKEFISCHYVLSGNVISARQDPGFMKNKPGTELGDRIIRDLAPYIKKIFIKLDKKYPGQLKIDQRGWVITYIGKKGG